MTLAHVARAAALLLAAAAGLTLEGCRQRRTPDDEHALPPPTARSLPSTTPSALPVDQALPGELAEGTDQAFGLLLPRGATVRGRFDDVVFARTGDPPDRVANYVRQHVDADKIETGPEKTLFFRATVKGVPGPHISVSVMVHAGFTEMEVRNVTLKPARQGLTPDERWRALGLNPDGSPLDPTTLQ